MQHKSQWLMKKYRIFVHKVNLESQIALKSLSTHTGRKNNIATAIECQINQQIQLCSISKGRNDNSNSEVYLILTELREEQEKSIGTVAFDFTGQKPGNRNPTLKQKQFIEGNGMLTYKLLGIEVIEIDQNIFEQQKNYRKQLLIEQQAIRSQKQLQNSQIIKLVQEKDQIIKRLQEKMTSLVKEIKRLNETIILQQKNMRNVSVQKKQKSKSKPFSINVNVQSNAQEKQIKRLLVQNQNLNNKIKQLQIKIQGLQDHIDDVESQLSQKRSVNKGNIDSKSKNKLVQSNYQQSKRRKTSIFVHKDQDKSQSNSLSGKRKTDRSKKADDDDWQQRRQRRKQERNKTKIKNLQEFLSNQRYQSQNKLKMTQEQRAKAIQSEVFKPNINNAQLLVMAQSNQLEGASRLEEQKLKITLTKIQQQRMMLEHRLYTKKDQADQIFKQLQKSKNRQKKLQEQLQSYRSMINYYKSHGISLGEISQQQRQYLKNLSRRGGLNPIGQFKELGQNQKQSIIQERLRFQIVELKDQIQAMKNQERIRIQEKDLQIMKKQLAQESQRKQKELFLGRCHELTQTIDKQRLASVQIFQKAGQLQPALGKIKDLEQNVLELTSKLNKETRDKNSYSIKLTKLQQVIQQRQQQWHKLKALQANYQVTKNKCINLQRSSQRFHQNFKDLKKFAMKIQQLMGRKPRKGLKQQSKQQQQQYKKQIIKRLQQLQKQLNQSQKKYYQQCITNYHQQKNLTNQHFSKRIKQQRLRIQALENLQYQSKLSLRDQAIKQFQKNKDLKISQIQQKIIKAQKLLNNLNGFIPAENLIERIQQLRQKMGEKKVSNALNIGKQFTELKEHVQKLKRQLIIKEQEINRIKKQGFAGQDKLNMRNSMMNDFLKTKQMLTKPFEDIKKINQELMKQKNTLQIQLQNCKIKQEQVTMRLKQKDKQIQRIQRKYSQQATRKQQHTSNAHKKFSDENLRLRQDLKQTQEGMKIVINQLKSVTDILVQKQDLISRLQQQNQKFSQRLTQYQIAQKSLMDQVKRVKDDSAANQAQFQRLFLQRDQKFLKIQKIKSIEIQKLKDQLSRTQVKLEKELLQSLKIREQNDRYVVALAEYDETIQGLKQAQRMMSQSYQNHKTQWIETKQILQQEINTLQKNLIQLAQQVTEKQLQVEQYRVKVQYNEKKIQSLQQMKQQFKQSQQLYYQNKIQAQNLIQDQVLEIKKLKSNYQIIQSKVQATCQENNDLRNINRQHRQQIDQLKQKLKIKQNQLIIFQKEKKSNNDSKIYVDKLSQQLKIKQQQHNNHIKQLNEQINLLKDQKQKLQQNLIQQSQKCKIMENKISQLETRSPGLKKKPSGRLGLPDGSSSNIKKSVSRIGSKRSINVDDDNKSINKSRMEKSRSKINAKDSSKQSLKASKRVIRQDSSIAYQKDSIIEKSFHDSNRISGKFSSDKQLKSKKDRQSVSQLLMLNQVKESDQGAKQSVNPSDVKDKKNGTNDNLDVKTSKMQLVRKNSKIEIQVSQCQSQQLEKRQDPPYVKNNIIEKKDSIQLQGQQGEQMEGDQYDEEQYPDVAELLDKIQLLEEQRDSLLEKIQLQQEDIQGYKAQLNTWKRAALDQKQDYGASQNQISHGFTSQLNQKLKMEQAPQQSRPSFRSKSKSKSMKPSDDFSRSAVVSKPSKINLNMSNPKINAEDARTMQILLQQAQQQVKMLQRKLDQEQQNVEKLLQTTKQLSTDLDKAQNKIYTLQDQKNKLQVQIQSLTQQIVLKNQQILAQTIQKQKIVTQLTKQLGQKNIKQQQKNIKIDQLYDIIKQKQQDIQNKNKQIKQMKKQFRTYQQQTQLEILKLKQGIQKYKIQIKDKNQQLTLIGDKYLQLQQKYNQLKIQLNHKQSLIQGKQLEGNQLLRRYYDTVNLVKELQLLKNQLEQKIGKLSTELNQKQQDVAILNKQSAITIKKYCIRVESLEEESLMLRKKLQDREDHLIKLKQEIAYNNQTIFEINKSKQSLSGELTRVQSQLKDIMQSYQSEFNHLNQTKINTQSRLQQQIQGTKDRQAQINLLNKQLNQKNRDLKQAINRLEQLNKNMQRFKIKSRNQVNQVYMELQIKNDQYEKIKKQLQRDSQAFFSKQCEFIQEKQKNQAKFKQLKQKLLAYENQINQLSQQMLEYTNRPSIDQWEQVNFQNELYRNRISQLQVTLKHQGNSQQELIYAQFKKYKANKQRQMQDLQSQLEKYAVKVNELEENNFYFKKQIQGLKHQLKIANSQKIKLQSYLLQIESENEEMKVEIDLFKAKRAQDLGRILDMSIN